jgi:hypothetical protein
VGAAVAVVPVGGGVAAVAVESLGVGVGLVVVGCVHDEPCALLTDALGFEECARSGAAPFPPDFGNGGLFDFCGDVGCVVLVPVVAGWPVGVGGGLSGSGEEGLGGDGGAVGWGAVVVPGFGPSLSSLCGTGCLVSCKCLGARLDS